MLTKSNLSRLSRLTRKEMNDALDVLENDSDEINVMIDDAKTKPITYVKLKITPPQKI